MSSVDKSIVSEIEKCYKDPAYFIRNYCIIKTETGKDKFNLYPYQEIVLEEIVKNSEIIINKSRQLGISTLMAAYALWEMSFKEDCEIVVISTGLRASRNLILKFQMMYELLPIWLKTPCREFNKLSVIFENRSRLSLLSSNVEASRSFTANVLILDEAAYIPNAEEIWISSAPLIAASKGKIIMVSSPNGVGNMFHRIWIDAINKKNGFCHLKLPWSVKPGLTLEWRKSQDDKMGKGKAAREFDCYFTTSGDTFIDPDDINHYRLDILNPIDKRKNNDLWIWKYAEVEHRYVLVCDTSRGDGSDNSAYHIIDIDENEQVAEYCGKIDNYKLAEDIIEMAKIYNNAMVLVENNQTGWTVLKRIVELGYNKIYRTPKQEFEGSYNVRISYSDKDSVLGLFTSTKTRREMMDKLYSFLSVDKTFKMKSSRLISELEVFIWKNGKPQAMNRYNDDLVMALAFYAYIREDVFYRIPRIIEKRRQYLKAFTVSKSADDFEDKKDINPNDPTQWSWVNE